MLSVEIALPDVEELQKLGAALVTHEELVQRHLARFELADELLKLLQRGFIAGWNGGGRSGCSCASRASRVAPSSASTAASSWSR